MMDGQGRRKMDVVVLLVAFLAVYTAAMYNRLQGLWHAVQQAVANVEATALDRTALAERLAGLNGRSGDQQPLAARLSAVEQELQNRRERCNADICAYNTYRSQVPQILLSHLAGFGKLEFVATERTPGAATRREAQGPRVLPMLASKRLGPDR